MIIVNFLETFLTPTQARLMKMDRVLDRLEASIVQSQYKSQDSKLQAKFDLFTRVLVAKLGSLQELDNILARIYRLFGIPRNDLSHFNIQGNIQDFNSILNRMADQISRSLQLLEQVSKKIQQCQVNYQDSQSSNYYSSPNNSYNNSYYAATSQQPQQQKPYVIQYHQYA